MACLCLDYCIDIRFENAFKSIPSKMRLICSSLQCFTVLLLSLLVSRTGNAAPLPSTAIAFDGECTYVVYGDSHHITNSAHDFRFSFARRGSDWLVATIDNPFGGLHSRWQWMNEDSTLYELTEVRTPTNGLYPQSMAIRTNTLPPFGWHFAQPILLAFAPDLVVSTNPVALPVSVYVRDDTSGLRRAWTMADETVPGWPLSRLRAYQELSPVLPAPGEVTAPKEPTLVFESTVSESGSVGNLFFASMVYQTAYHPLPPAAPGSRPGANDVSPTSSLILKVDKTSVRIPEDTFVAINKKTVVSDYRSPNLGVGSVTYVTTKVLLKASSTQIRQLAQESLKNEAARQSTFRTGTKALVFMGVVTVGIIAAALKLKKD